MEREIKFQDFKKAQETIKAFEAQKEKVRQERLELTLKHKWRYVDNDEERIRIRMEIEKLELAEQLKWHKIHRQDKNYAKEIWEDYYLTAIDKARANIKSSLQALRIIKTRLL